MIGYMYARGLNKVTYLPLYLLTLFTAVNLIGSL